MGNHIKRRSFLTLLGGAAAAWPLAARAQQGSRLRRIGVLSGGAEDDPEYMARLVGFRQGLEKLGWSEGRNVRIDYLHASASAERTESLAKEAVAQKPEVILAGSSAVAAALQREGSAIPIVFVSVSDPIGSGFIASLARPGGNLTGLMNFEASIVGKWLAMLKEIAPQLRRVTLLGNPKTSPYDYFQRAAEAPATTLAISLVASRIETAADIERAIESFAQAPNGGLVVPPDVTTTLHRELIARLAALHRLPAVYAGRVPKSQARPRRAMQ